VAQGLAALTGGEVGHRREPEATEARGPRGDHFQHGRHPHRVGAEALQHPDLRRGLVARPEQAGVDALREGDLESRGLAARERPELRVVSQRHVGEAGLAREDRADQRIPARQIEVIRDQHDGARPEAVPDPAGGVGDDQRAGA